jgi:hypothetical protein
MTSEQAISSADPPLTVGDWARRPRLFGSGPKREV